MLEHLEHFFEALGAFVTVIAVCAPWIWRWLSRINVTYTFAKDMATNHLPHIYMAQRLIAKKLGVEIPDEVPVVKFMPINGKDK